MRRSNSSPSVALFPFLAVLVCAMGALILLLLVTTRKMRQVAVARAQAAEAEAAEEGQLPIAAPIMPIPAPVLPKEPEKSPEGPQLVQTGPTPEEAAEKEAERRALRVAREARQRVNEESRKRQAQREREWQRMLVELEAKRESHRDQLQQSGTILKELKGRLQRTETNLQKLQSHKQQLESKKSEDAQERAKIEQQHQELADAITAAQKEMAELRKAHADAASKYAFIPYDGASGTTRRPIYIECTAAGMRFQPEGVLLEEDDLKGFTESQNPLLFATQAIIGHWQANPAPEEDPRRPRRPYVLLLIRPSGTVTYYVARKMLSQLGDDFGYELIEGDFELQLPPSDGKTKTVIERAVAEALRYREQAQVAGTQVSMPRLGAVTIGEQRDEAIDFGTLNDKQAAAVAEKESPFTKHSTRQGKNFSITRSPVRQEELLPNSVRTELDRHPADIDVGKTASAKSSGTTNPGSGGAGVTGQGDGSGAGGQGGVNDGGTSIVKGADPSIEIQKGRGRRNQFGKSNGTDPANSGGQVAKISRLPVLTDPFSRQALAEAGAKDPAPTGEDPDAALGFSGGVDQSGSPGMGSATGRGGLPGATGLAGSGIGSAGGQSPSSTTGKGPAIPGARSGTVFDLPQATKSRGAVGNVGQSNSGVPGKKITFDESGTPDGISGGTATKEGPGGEPLGTAVQRGRQVADSGASGAKSQFNGTDLNAGVNDPETDPRARQPGQVSGGPSTTTGQRKSSGGSPSRGAMSQSRGGGSSAGNIASPFDLTEGKVVAETTTNSVSSDNPIKVRKSYGDNPEERSIPRPGKNLTPTQKQEIGRQRWGGSNVGQIGFERKVKVQIQADKIVIGKNELEIEIEPGMKREELVEAVLDGLDDNSQTWGKPPKRFYWIPYLQFEVYKGGVVQYEQIHGPLKEWGLFSDVQFKDGVPGEHGLIRPVSKAVTPKTVPPETSKDSTSELPKFPATKRKATPVK